MQKQTEVRAEIRTIEDLAEFVERVQGKIQREGFDPARVLFEEPITMRLSTDLDTDNLVLDTGW